MRADRLVATLLLLQTRGRLTAAQVAQELEVSERTARRDLEALGTAGVPVYSAQGRGGGWSLVGGARTNLSGLNADEARALFLVAGAAGAATPQVKAALRKLLQALPAPLRDGAAAAAGAVVIDHASWGRTAPAAPPHLGALQQAVVDAEQVLLAYSGRGKAPSERTVSPLGLVAKGGVWYLVAGTDAGVRTFRVGRVTAVQPIGVPCVRPEGFDLAAAWEQSTSEVQQRRSGAVLTGLAQPTVLPVLRGLLGARLSVQAVGPGEDRPDGRVEVAVAGPSAQVLAKELAGFGSALEVTGPPEARTTLVRLSRELADLYAGRGGP